MTTNIYLNPYKPESEGAKALSQAMGIKRIAPEGKSKFKGSADKIVINWGASSVSDEVAKCDVINKPEAVAIAADKLKFFKSVSAYNSRVRSASQRAYIPSYWTDADYARDVVAEDRTTLVARTVLNGHSGRGIVLIESISDFVDAPLYVQYVPKKQEYRVHVAGGVVVDVQRKARREDVPDDQVNWKIRNHDNGFVFARNESLGEVPPSVTLNAANAVKAIGLDFGAVDVIFNEKQQQAYVLEVNTAPGMSGQTLDNYVARMTEICKSRATKKTKFDDVVWWTEHIRGNNGDVLYDGGDRAEVCGMRVNRNIASQLVNVYRTNPSFDILTVDYYTEFQTRDYIQRTAAAYREQLANTPTRRPAISANMFFSTLA